MSSAVTFSSRFKVGSRIYFGFGTILSLLVAIGTMSYVEIQTSIADFDRYSDMTHNAVRIGTIDTDVAEMRRNVVAYAASGDPALCERIAKARVEAAKHIDEAEKHFRDPERRAEIG